MICVSIFSSDTMWRLEENNSPRESEEEDEERKRGKNSKIQILYICCYCSVTHRILMPLIYRLMEILACDYSYQCLLYSITRDLRLGDLVLKASLFLPFKELRSLDLRFNAIVGCHENQGLCCCYIIIILLY